MEEPLHLLGEGPLQPHVAERRREVRVLRGIGHRRLGRGLLRARQRVLGDALEVRQARQRRGHLHRLRAADDSPVVRTPRAFGDCHLARLHAALHHRRHQQVVAHHELVEHQLVTLARILEVHRPQHGDARAPAFGGQRHDARREAFAQADHVAHDRLRPGREHAPRRAGEHEHRREALDLQVADEELVLPVEPAHAAAVVAARASAHEVRDNERIAELPGGDHVGDAAAHLAPLRVLVAQRLHERQPAHLPGLAALAERDLERHRLERARQVRGLGHAVVGDVVAGRELARSAAVEEEALHAVVGHDAPHRIHAPLAAERRGRVPDGAVAVPPRYRHALVPLAVAYQPGVLEDAVVRAEVAVRHRVHRHERREPQDHAEAEVVQLLHHPLRIPEAVAVEGPVAEVVRMPETVYLEHARLHAVGEEALRVLEDVVLVLVVVELHPRVEDGLLEPLDPRHSARREECARAVPVRAPERAALRPAGLNWCKRPL